MEYRTNDYRTNIAYDHGHQNESRADRSEWMLAVSSDRSGENEPSEVATDVSDALANLAHFCVRAGLDFDALVDHAKHAAIGDLEDGPEALRDTVRFP
jgi:hypothetical protein